MQEIVGFFEEPESIECLEAELPLVLRLRRAWSCGNIWDLRKACEDDFVCLDCTSPVASASSKCGKFMDDSASASTCDDGDVSSVSSISSDESGVEDCMGSVSSSWVEEMQASEAPKSRANPPGIWAMPSESFTIPPGQWTSTLGKLDGPPGKLCGPPGNHETPTILRSSKGDLVKSVKKVQRSNAEAWFRYTAEYGENTRDPSKHTVRFLEDFLRQYNGGIPEN
jgi:hypothetical protein